MSSVETLQGELRGIVGSLPVAELHHCNEQVQGRARQLGELSLTSNDHDLLATTELLLAAGQHIDAAAQQLVQVVERVRAYQPRL